MCRSSRHLIRPVARSSGTLRAQGRHGARWSLTKLAVLRVETTSKTRTATLRAQGGALAHHRPRSGNGPTSVGQRSNGPRRRSGNRPRSGNGPRRRSGNRPRSGNGPRPRSGNGLRSGNGPRPRSSNGLRSGNGPRPRSGNRLRSGNGATVGQPPALRPQNCCVPPIFAPWSTKVMPTHARRIRGRRFPGTKGSRPAAFLGSARP